MILDNTVDLAASEGPTATLMAHHLLHLEDSCVLIPPQLSCPTWTGMRRATIQYESFIRFIDPYAPPGKSADEVTAHQLGFIRGLVVPEPAVLLSLADQLEELKATPTKPSKAVTEPREEEGAKEETPKKTKSAETGDPPKRHHRSREEKAWSRHSPTEKSPASSSREHNVTLETEKLGDAVAQTCLSVVRVSRAVEKAHNSTTTETLLMKQRLEKAYANAVESMKEGIQGARTSADMWWIEKRITVQVSCERAKAYCVLTQHHGSVSDDLTGKGGSSTKASEVAEAEENCKSMSNLVSTVITEGAKLPGECGVALISSVFRLVLTLPPAPVLTPTIDLPPERECGIILGDASRNVSASQNIVSSLPSSPLTGGAGVPMVAGRSTIRFGQAMIQPVTFTQPSHLLFKKPTSTPMSTPQKGWGTPDARSSPLLKESSASPEDTPDLTKSPADPSVIIEDVVDDEDEASAPDKLGSSKVKSTRESSKQ